MAKPFFVRCFVKQASEGVWVAACIDLNLAAQGDSCEEAKAKLEAQFQDYVTQAVTVDREHMHELLNRKAPLSIQLEYRFIALLAMLGLAGDDRQNEPHSAARRKMGALRKPKRAGLFEELVPRIA